MSSRRYPTTAGPENLDGRPDIGTWHYRYNIFGALIWQKDAKGQVLTLSYDTLGRLIEQVDLEGTATLRPAAK